MSTSSIQTNQKYHRSYNSLNIQINISFGVLGMNADSLRRWIVSPDGIVSSSGIFPAVEDPIVLRRKSPRFRDEFKNIDYTKTAWGLMIRNELVKSPETREGKMFRRRFRLPFQLFLILVEICRDNNVFEVTNYSRTKIPIEIKLLCCLRVLGRDDCFDAIEEYSNIPEKTAWWFFKLFLKNFVRCLKHQVVRPPTEGIELSKVMKVYTKMGFPGAIGSVDATHIRWHMCPVDKVHLATGKEKYPSVAFQVPKIFFSVVL